MHFAVVNDIVSLGKNMDLEVNNEDMEKLVDHKIELSTEELKHFQEQQQKAIVEEMSSEEEEGKDDILSSMCREICAKLGKVQSFGEQYHPYKAVAGRSINTFAMAVPCLIL